MTADPSSETRKPIDRYLPTRIHSEGGLGRVWLADDPEIGREIALKELLAEQAARPQARARFLREAQITGQLEHPNIVPVYEVGERDDDGRPYYTMRFVRGSTLSKAICDEFERPGDLRAWPRSRRLLLRALCSVGSAIAHAHSRGIVHRDLKPDNIILGRHGELILLDWGLAKRLEDDTLDESDSVEKEVEPDLVSTHAGSILGTIAYMSPEQADGRPTDERTDVYGLGAILFEILTGGPPHGGEDPGKVVRSIIERETPRPSDRVHATPKALEAICCKAMARRPEDRFATATEVVEELERWLADEPVLVRPDSPIERVARWVRQHQSWALAGTVALLVVVVVSLWTAITLGAAADRERMMRERSILASAKLAARAVANEIDLRWSLLESAATEIAVHNALESGDDTALQAWIELQADKHAVRAPARSWIVQDRLGVQRARAPYSDASVGDRFGFRDYFHGQGLDLPDRAVTPEPIRESHRSIVFRSQVTGNLMVAFSVPIWGFVGERPGVIGVLGMTVELGQFGVLQLGLEQNPALVDTRSDFQGRRGLVIQHPGLEQLPGTTPTSGARARDASYVTQARVDEFVRLREASLEGSLVSALDRNYIDPVPGSSGSWLAAFEPVTVNSREGTSADTGWVVVVQERDRVPGR